MVTQRATLQRITKFLENQRPTAKQQRAFLKKLTRKQKTALARELNQFLRHVEITQVLANSRKSKSIKSEKTGRGATGRPFVLIQPSPSGDCMRCPDTGKDGGVFVGCENFLDDDGDLEIRCYYVPPWFFGWIWGLMWSIF